MAIPRNLANLANQLNTDGEVPKIEVGDSKVEVTDTGSNGTIVFNTDGSEKMRVTSGGNVGIGTTSPSDSGNYVAADHIIDLRGTNGGVLYTSDTSATIRAFFGNWGGGAAIAGSYTNHPLFIYTNNTERARITSGGNLLVGTTTNNASGGVIQVSNGITFPATQSASSDANTLDDYEEGTWSPVITDGTNDATMNAATVGFYTKIGRLVTVNGFCQTSSKGSITTGALFMKGLPFTIANTGNNNYGGGTIGVADQLAITANQVAVLTQDAYNVTRVRLGLWKAITGTDALTGSNWNNTGYIGFTYSYIAAT